MGVPAIPGSTWLALYAGYGNGAALAGSGAYGMGCCGAYPYALPVAAMSYDGGGAADGGAAVEPRCAMYAITGSGTSSSSSLS